VGKARKARKEAKARKAKGDLGHLASPSLGHYALLSFVVRGKGMVQFGIWDFGFRIEGLRD
jgi:hypothetical protein